MDIGHFTGDMKNRNPILMFFIKFKQEVIFANEFYKYLKLNASS